MLSHHIQTNTLKTDIMNKLGAFKVWSSHITNEAILQRMGNDRKLLTSIKIRATSYFVHILATINKLSHISFWKRMGDRKERGVEENIFYSMKSSRTLNWMSNHIRQQLKTFTPVWTFEFLRINNPTKNLLYRPAVFYSIVWSIFLLKNMFLFHRCF